MLIKQPEFRVLGLDLLIPHPFACGHMGSDKMMKLKRVIQQTRQYQPLVVRSHPAGGGNYEVIDGRSRLSVLRSLDVGTAQCVVWSIDDDDTILTLATLNQLHGNEVPERRAVIIQKLMRSWSVDQLKDFLPDSGRRLETLLRVASLDEQERCEPDEKVTSPVAIGFAIEHSEARILNLALDVEQQRHSGTRGQALANLARHYLDDTGLGVAVATSS